MRAIEWLRSMTSIRILSFLTAFMLSLSILFSLIGAIGNTLIQTLASIAIVLGTLLELFQILIVIQVTNRNDKVGWILHRFAYVTLFVMILSFLSIFGGSYLSSFFIFGKDVMIIAVIGYVMQASFGICLSAVTYHFLQVERVWQERTLT